MLGTSRRDVSLKTNTRKRRMSAQPHRLSFHAPSCDSVRDGPRNAGSRGIRPVRSSSMITSPALVVLHHEANDSKADSRPGLGIQTAPT